MRQIVIIDEMSNARGFGKTLSESFITFAAEDEAALKKIINVRVPDAVVINADYIGDDLFDFTSRVRRILPSYEIPVILTTADGNCENQSAMFKCDVDEILHLPLCREILIKSISRLLPKANTDTTDLESAFGVDDLMHMVSEESSDNGSYFVNHGHFTSICRFVKRGLERSRKNVQVLLMTIINVENKTEFIENNIMKLLSNAVKICLRRGDISSVCSKNQIVILLMDADDDGGHLVANRIVSNFYSECDDDKLQLQYDIRELSRTS